MASPAPAPTRIRFDAFELDVASGELRKSGILLRLRPQPFRVLLLLIERAGQVVTREEIQRCLWTDSTFVDFEHGINFSINQIRGALVDNAENPRYVETIPRRGYRFIGAVEQETASSSASAIDVQPSVKPAHKKYAFVAACVALLAPAFAAYHFWPRATTPSGHATITPISRWNKPMNSARLSPDGHAVAFVSPVGGITQVFLMLTSGGGPLQLTNDEGNKFVNAFSPDGREVYYRRTLGREEVWAVPTLGGAPRRVVSASYVFPSPDGASIFYLKVDSPGIFRAGKSGLNEELFYSPKDIDLWFVPLLLFPGGNDILAVAMSSDWQSQFRFYRINGTSHEEVDLGEVSGKFWDIVWAEPGNSILFSRTVNELTNIWKYSLKDRSLTQITFGAGPDFSPMPDPGGKGIYFVNGKASGFLTAYNVHSKQSTDIASENATEPAISPDGKRVMYVTAPSRKRSELWVSDIDGGNKVKIATGEDLWTGTWAPDNFHLSFQEPGFDAGVGKAYIVGADGSGLRQLPPIGGRPSSTVWSPDQKSIYVSAVKKVGSIPAVWKWNVEGSNLERFVDNCFAVSDADPSGKYLLGLVLMGEKIGIYEVSTSDRKCTSLLPGAVTLGAVFAHDGKSFLYAVASHGEVTIYRQPWRDGKLIGTPQVALKVPFAFPLDDAASNAYDFSGDLSTIVYARPSGQADLYLLSQK